MFFDSLVVVAKGNETSLDQPQDFSTAAPQFSYQETKGLKSAKLAHLHHGAHALALLAALLGLALPRGAGFTTSTSRALGANLERKVRGQRRRLLGWQALFPHVLEARGTDRDLHSHRKYRTARV